MVRSVNKYFDTLYVKLERSLNALDLTAMKQILNCMIISRSDNNNCRFMDNVKEITNDVHIKMSYEKMIDTIQKKMHNVQQDLIKFDFTNSERMRTETEKRKAYEQMKDQVNTLKNCKTIEDHLGIDTDKEYVEKTVNKIENNIQNVCDWTLSKVAGDKLSTNIHELTQINNNYSNLKIIAPTNITGSKKTSDYLNETCKKIKDGIIECINSKRTDALKVCNDADKLAPYLAELQLFQTILISFSNYTERVIDECLQQYKKKNGKIRVLLTVLETDETVAGGWGNILVSEHGMFKGEAISKFNKLMVEAGIDEVLKKLGCNDNSINVEKIKLRYKKFDKKYKQLVNQNLRKNPDLAKLVGNAERIARKCKNVMVEVKGWFGTEYGAIGKWNADFKNNAIDLMAYVFAIWTLQNSSYYFEVSDKNDDRSYLMQPRVAQVVSIIRLLSIDVEETRMVNNLVEIGTGEGKSLTLAIASCILAMIGFDVSCACYSQYSSARDHKSFQELFQVLNVDKYIYYGTFNQICERIINDKGDIRALTKDMIVNNNKFNYGVRGKYKFVKSNKGIGYYKRDKILLIDEVDVFFSEEFYGNTYTPAITIQDDSIKKITDLIWQDHEAHGTTQSWKLTFERIKQEAAYKQLQKRFGRWAKLLDEAIKDMLVDVRVFEKNVDYVIKDCKIGYKDGDEINTNATLGYKTLFTYYKEKACVSPQSFKDSIAIYIKCGNFSYAEIAGMSNFVSILGVTGTLKQLSNKEKEIIEKTYNIVRHTYMPSLFGDRKYRFRFHKKNDIHLYNDDDYFRELASTIQKKLNENGKDKRCMFVCFESNQKMREFLNCKEFGAFAKNSLILNEELNEKEKNKIVAAATISGQITLFPRIFGRGTDFQVEDEKLKNNGGPHVISTFLSKQLSEEVQIQGRTARQGGYGSYSMVLKKSELEQFGVTQDEIKREEEKKYPEMYELLNTRRIKKFEEDYKRISQTVKQAKVMHEQAEALANAVRAGDVNTAKSSLIKLNCGASRRSTRIAVLMNARGSMSGLLRQAKDTINTVFNRVGKILIDNDMDAKCFQIQFIAYRSYDSAASDELLQISGWSSDGAYLKTFLNGVNANHSQLQGTEALEVALQHVNRMVEKDNDNFARALVIGDAPPTRSFFHVTYYRAQYSSRFNWENSEYFAQATFWQDELKKLVKNGIVVDTYYLKDEAKNAFETIANETNGNCRYLDANSSTIAEELTRILSMTVLEECDKMFCKLMHI